jgi:enoyl-CoA hydratase/carnithine racemase
MSQYLIYEQRGHVVTLTMNEPERRNPLTGNSAIPEFLAAFERIRTDRSVRALVLTGAGNAFSAGGDIRAMHEQALSSRSALEIRQEHVDGIQRLPLALFDLEVPVIAAVNGAAVGAGLDLTCMCDVRIASEKAKFSASFVKLGLIPGDGGAWLLPRIIGLSRAAELSYTGDTFDAHQALAWGLVSQVVPADALLDTAMALAGRIAQNPPQAVRMTKRLLRESMHSRLDASLQVAASLQSMLQQLPDHLEAVKAFLEKRLPIFRG